MADFMRIYNIVEETISVLENPASHYEIDGIVLRLDYVVRTLVNLDSGLSEIDDILRLLGEVIFKLQNQYNDETSYLALEFTPKIHSGDRGRPSFQITEEQLSTLIDQGFKVTIIAQLLGVSSRTIERRMSKFGLSIAGSYSNIADPDLDTLTRQAQREHPGIGLRMLKGYLRGKGLRLQWERVRQSLLRTDPTGVHQRWSESIHRRKYWVPGPLALWHIDGHHKLIRWRIVVHGGIDGFSRLPVYVHASCNNKAATVLELFRKAVDEYGLPSRVRCDKGGENYDVGWFILNHPRRGPGRGSIIAGKSTHNQRIERLWRDVYADCLSLFYQIFQYLEMQHLLDPDDDVQIWCLHLVYLPMINKHLKTWKDSWVHHPIRTEKNYSPMQLWISGLVLTQFGQNRILDNLEESLSEEEINQYGIDWDGPVNMDGSSLVEVPDTSCPLDDHNLQVLIEQIDPTIYDGYYGISTFMDIVSFVTNLLQNQG